MHKKIWLILGVVFLGVGIFMGGIALIVNIALTSHRNQILNDSEPVTAVITEITRRQTPGAEVNLGYTAYIQYEFEGATFTGALNWWSSRMYVGQSVEIHVNRQNPARFVSNNNLHLIPVLVMAPMLLIFGGLGVGFLMKHASIKRRHRWLLDFGTPVWANIIEVTEDWRGGRVNGRPPKVVVAAYENMRFVSGPVDNNDLMHMGRNQHVKVLIHPENSNRYTFDFKNESYLTPLDPPKPLQKGVPNDSF